jgi:FixJ family two-component response regulator
MVALPRLDHDRPGEYWGGLACQPTNRAEWRFAMGAGQVSTVLLIEDDDSVRKALERLINTSGMECAAFASGESLLARGSVEDATCIVSDLKLPGMSGFELLAELRARGVVSPFIVITAHDTPGLREEAIQRGAAAYLAKPFRGTALIEAVNEVIGLQE